MATHHDSIDAPSKPARKSHFDPDAPDFGQVKAWVSDGDHESLQEAFDRFDLSTNGLLHSANTGDMVDHLVDLGADVNQPLKDVSIDMVDHLSDAQIANALTPLQEATRQGNKDVFDRLLAHGADFEIGGEARPLMLALQRTEPEAVAMANDLLDRGARVHAESGEYPAILQAVQPRHGHGATVVKRLLENGANPNVANSMGVTPLHRADAEATDLLCDYGADLNAQDKHGNTPLHVAMRHGLGSDGSTHIDRAQRLVERGADIEAKNHEGRTPLHVVAVASNSREDEAKVSLLLDAGANVNARDTKGRTPLHEAAWGNVVMVKRLCDHGADLNAQDQKGLTPLHFAAMGGDVKSVKSLLNRGADLNLMDHEGKTAHHRAVREAMTYLSDIERVAREKQDLRSTVEQIPAPKPTGGEAMPPRRMRL